MPYTPITCVNGVTPINATFGNLIQTQYAQAMTSHNLDLIPTAYVASGLVASKDAVTANKLNVTAGRAYLIQADGNNDLGVQAPAASSQTTATINTTYFLDLNPNGTWSFATSHSATANYLPIAQVTTDGSGNILTVTDKRVLTTGILASGALAPVVASQQMAASVTPSQAGYVVGGVTFGGAAAIAGDASAASATFNGTTGTIVVPTSGIPSGAAACTIEAWVNISGNPSAAAVVAAHGNWFVAHQILYIVLNTNGTVQAANGSISSTASAALSLNTWHHVITKWDGTKLFCYVDSVATDTGTADASHNVVLNAAGIGAAPDRSGSFLPGKIAEVAWYSGALSAARITAHFTAATAGGYAAAVASDTPLRYYRLNEPVGALYANSSIASTLQTLDAAGASTLGRVASIGGQASVGTLGAPVIVAQAVVNVVNGTATTVLTYAATNGLYLVNATVSTGGANGAGGNMTLQVTSTDPFGNHQNTHNFTAAGVGANIFLSGSAGGTGPGVSAGTEPITVFGASGTNITVLYQNTASPVNDTVQVVIVRLA